MSDRLEFRSLSDEVLSAFIDGQLPDEERWQVEARLAGDAEARRRLVQLQQVVDLLAELPRVPVPRPFTLSEAMVGRSPQRWAWPAWLKPFYLRGAAIVVALCLLIVGLGDLGTRAGWLPASGSPVVATAELGGLSPTDGNPTAIAGKASTSEVAAKTLHPTFLDLSPTLLAGLEIGLTMLLVALVAVSWRWGHLA